jgi:hypothetical protein
MELVLAEKSNDPASPSVRLVTSTVTDSVGVDVTTDNDSDAVEMATIAELSVLAIVAEIPAVG